MDGRTQHLLARLYQLVTPSFSVLISPLSFLAVALPVVADAACGAKPVQIGSRLARINTMSGIAACQISNDLQVLLGD